MKENLVQKIFLSMIFFILGGCAYNQTFNSAALKNASSFEGKTGVVGVLLTNFSSSCDSESGEIILYGPDGKKEQIDFTMNSVFASYLPSGTHRIEEVRYRCNYSTRRGTTINYFKWYFDTDNMYAKDLLVSESPNSINKTFIIHGMATVRVPKRGFCKFAVTPKTDGKWNDQSDILTGEKIAIDLDYVASCK